MTTNQRKKRAGVAAKTVTQIAAGGAAANDTQNTAQPVTRKYRPRARKCADKACRTVFTPKAKHGKYCSDACRQRDHRARHPQRARRPNGVERLTCEHCGNWYVGTVGKGSKYCTPTCKRLAAKARREAVAQGLAAALGLAVEDARDRVELVGMAAARRAVACLIDTPEDIGREVCLRLTS